MTLALYVPDRYVGNGSTANYGISNAYISPSDIVATVAHPTTGAETTLDLTDDFTLSEAVLSLVDAGQAWIDDSGYFANGWILVIQRIRPLTQETDIRNQGDFYPEVHEDEFDNGRMIAQQQQEQLDRCVKVPVTSDTDPDELIDTLTDSVAAAQLAETGAETARDLAIVAKVAAEAAAALAGAGVATGTISGGALNLNAATASSFNVTANANFTLNIPTNGQAGQRISIRITQDGTGSRILTLHANFLISSELKASPGVVLSTAAGKIDKVGLYCVDGTVWEVEAFATDFAVAA